MIIPSQRCLKITGLLVNIPQVGVDLGRSAHVVLRLIYLQRLLKLLAGRLGLLLPAIVCPQLDQDAGLGAPIAQGSVHLVGVSGNVGRASKVFLFAPLFSRRFEFFGKGTPPSLHQLRDGFRYAPGGDVFLGVLHQGVGQRKLPGHFQARGEFIPAVADAG